LRDVIVLSEEAVFIGLWGMMVS